MKGSVLLPMWLSQKFGRESILLLFCCAFTRLSRAFGDDPASEGLSKGAAVSWVTNRSAVFYASTYPSPAFYTNVTGKVLRKPVSNIPLTNLSFDHFLPQTLSQMIWTNFTAHTNGRSTGIFSLRQHPEGWPLKPPHVAWNTNSLVWGMRGLTALSPCWEAEGSPGQVPVTLLTRRHGYTRGHGLGPDGFRSSFKGKKVWFLTLNNKIVEATVSCEVCRTIPAGAKRDYTILLFSRDVPSAVSPMRVANSEKVIEKYPIINRAPRPLFKTEQGGYLSAEILPFTVQTWKQGDSGSPDMLPMPGELIFTSGRSTSGPDERMQRDMDELCRLDHLDATRYQMQWLDLSKFPSP